MSRLLRSLNPEVISLEEGKKLLQKQQVRKSSPEHSLQVECVAWFKTAYPKFEKRIAAIPNGGRLLFKHDKKGNRYSPEGQKLKREGLLPGLMDVVILIPRMQYGALLIELKVGHNKPSPQQIELTKELENDYCVRLCYSIDEFQKAVIDYLQLKPIMFHV